MSDWVKVIYEPLPLFRGNDESGNYKILIQFRGRRFISDKYHGYKSEKFANIMKEKLEQKLREKE